jgi:hypothetical protein
MPKIMPCSNASEVVTLAADYRTFGDVLTMAALTEASGRFQANKLQNPHRSAYIPTHILNLRLTS